jgi:hypothetical protein
VAHGGARGATRGHARAGGVRAGAFPRQVPRDGRVAGGKAGTGGFHAPPGAGRRLTSEPGQIRGEEAAPEFMIPLLCSQAKASACGIGFQNGAGSERPSRAASRLARIGCSSRPRRCQLQLDNFLRPWNLNVSCRFCDARYACIFN